MNVKNVGRPLFVPHNLLYISEFILPRSPIIAKNVGKPLSAAQNLPDIIAFILVRNPVNVRNVGRPLDRLHTLLNSYSNITLRVFIL